MSTCDKDKFFKACINGSIDYLEKVLKEDKILEQSKPSPGLDLDIYNILNLYGWSPLYAAVKYGEIEVINLLLKCGFDVNFGGYEVDKSYKIIYDLKLTSPLEVACIYRNTDKSLKMVKLLLEKGADPNHRFLYPPLIQIVMDIFGYHMDDDEVYIWDHQKVSKKVEIFKLLLDYGADPGLKFGKKKKSIYNYIPDDEDCESYEVQQQLLTLIKDSKRKNYFKPAKRE